MLSLSVHRLITAGLVGIATQAAAQCSFDVNDEYRYNMTGLEVASPFIFHEQGKSDQYLVSVCKPLELECPQVEHPVAARIFRLGPGGFQCTNAFGNASSVTTALLGSSEKEGVVIQYQGGGRLGAQGSVPLTRIRVSCVPEAETPVLQSVTPVSRYELQVSIDFAGACPTRILHKRPFPIGAGLFIAALVLFFLYCSVGALYKHATTGAEGIEMLPNVDVWRPCLSCCGGYLGACIACITCSEQGKGASGAGADAYYEGMDDDDEDDAYFRPASGAGGAVDPYSGAGGGAGGGYDAAPYSDEAAI